MVLAHPKSRSEQPSSWQRRQVGQLVKPTGHAPSLPAPKQHHQHVRAAAAVTAAARRARRTAAARRARTAAARRARRTAAAAVAVTDLGGVE
jgi:hypothetical protein